jgi:dTDP-glucose 4,6-dehydratase
LILITGGAGFIGSNFILQWLNNKNAGPVINFDKLTYAGNLQNLATVQNDPRYHFVQADINDRDLLQSLLNKYHPRAVLHFAAESHVDRSILGPDAFIQTNVNGTFNLLEAVRSYWSQLSLSERANFRLLHVSTDEVYGALTAEDPLFSEATAYAPRSPYAASKAASDHLVHAYYHTFGLPTIITNCSNNYGPYQFPEKLIPLMILNAVQGKALPIYGDGLQVRDWLYVEDHCAALRLVLENARVGETYNIGGCNEKTNLEVVKMICAILDEICVNSAYIPHQQLLATVQDRPGHDRRYAIDASKIQKELHWRPQENFASGLLKTVKWYLENQTWCNMVTSGEYKNWMAKNYQQRATL